MPRARKYFTEKKQKPIIDLMAPLEAPAKVGSSVDRGVLIIAIGENTKTAPYYGFYAANLAASIRQMDSDIKIHLVHSVSSISQLTAQHKALFSSMQLCPPEYYTTAGKHEYWKAKTFIYELSPFQETLFLDADMIILPTKKISEVMAGLSAVCDFTIKNRGFENIAPGYTYWFEVPEARKVFKIKGRIYQTQSEFIFFKKTEKCKQLFASIRKVYDTRPLTCTDHEVVKGAKGLPDEYAFNLGMALTGTYPHKDNYNPLFWPYLQGHKNWYKDVILNYVGFSLGGETVPDWILQKLKAYKELFRQTLKLPYLYNIPAKKQWGK